MTIKKTHTGIVITKDGPQRKKLHQTESMWVVGKTECYRKDTGKRHFAEHTRRRLLLDSIEAVITRVLDVRPYRHFWIVEVDVFSWGRYSSTTIIRDIEKDARQVKPGDTVTV